MSRKTSDLQREIDKLIHLIFWNRTLVSIVRGKRNPRRKRTTQLQFVRQVNFVPIEHSEEPAGPDSIPD